MLLFDGFTFISFDRGGFQFVSIIIIMIIIFKF